ncbi:bifunctional folylpolyglutamate synthase/dihydrofolate synthase [bacterium]|nr:bifunctional folylpolyglutamate synthase/dihydrofolate synthase [bacterium]
MNQPKALQYIFDLQRIGIKFGLNNTERILHALGDPHLNLNVIHIAGTNGKGSTSAMVTAILKAAGYKTGLYTSPHLIRLSERIQIDGRPISEDELIKGAEKIQDVIQGLVFNDSHPTYFEALTCMAFSLFSKQDVDFAVMEVGMGGRLDATNVCIPKITVITSISFDHQEYLGNTLREIAQEKAGIIKKGCPVVCGALQEEALDEIKKTCESKGSPLYIVNDLYDFKEIYPESDQLMNTSKIQNGTQTNLRFTKGNENHLSCHSGKGRNPGFSNEILIPQVSINRKGQHYITITPRLPGRFQIRNTLLALETIERLREYGISIPDKAIKDGLSQTVWPGRIQVIFQNPFLILDGAHNPAAAQNLAESIQSQYRYKDLILMLGILKDKDIAGICKAIVPLADKIVLSSPKIERSASVEKLYEIIMTHRLAEGKKILTISYVPDAIETARALANPEDLILITGSTYTVGEAMSHLGVKPFPDGT